MTQTEIQFATPPWRGQGNDATPAVAVLAYTTDQVCAALQISKVTLWRLEKRGLLRSMPHLRHKRYAATAVSKLLST